MLDEECLDGAGMMDGTVVQEQVKVIVAGVDVVQQPSKELQEFSASFALGNEGGDFTGHGIQCAEHRHAAILTSRWNDDSLAPLGPAAGQARIQVELGFVDIHESTTTGAGFRFFKARHF